MDSRTCQLRSTIALPRVLTTVRTLGYNGVVSRAHGPNSNALLKRPTDPRGPVRVFFVIWDRRGEASRAGR